MIYFLFKYYGIDWIVLILVLIQVWMLGNRRKEGFLVGIAGACFGIGFAYLSGSLGNGVLAVCLFYLHIKGYMQWKEVEHEQKEWRSKKEDFNKAKAKREIER